MRLTRKARILWIVSFALVLLIIAALNMSAIDVDDSGLEAAGGILFVNKMTPAEEEGSNVIAIMMM